MTRVEVITSVERRRRWSAAEKQEIVAETAKPGRTVSGVARRYGIAASQVFAWRRQFLAAATGIVEDGFLPVEVSVPVPAIADAGMAPGAGGRIEIILPDGVVVRVDRDVGAEPLRRVLSALR